MFATRNPYTSCSIHFTKLMNNTLVSPGVENLLNRIPKIPRSISLTSTLSLPSTFWKDEKKMLRSRVPLCFAYILDFKKKHVCSNVQLLYAVCTTLSYYLEGAACYLVCTTYHLVRTKYFVITTRYLVRTT